MAEAEAPPPAAPPESSLVLEGGTYEVIRHRLSQAGEDLRARLARLNSARQDVFGAIPTTLLTTEHVTTANNCLPRDITPAGPERFLLGCNVHLGLRSEIRPADVFTAYTWKERKIHDAPIDFLLSREFEEDFQSLHKYYKHAVFSKFAHIGPHLFFVFQTGPNPGDFKTFKWHVAEDGAFTYLGNRSDHEYRLPPQHEFEWKRTHRELHRGGLHPHISIEDRLFVETIGGDLTIKIEDNTDTGEGIHSEPVEHKDQTLDDAEIHYALLGNLILLKIRPYQEKAWRHFVFNQKLARVHRIDAIEHACVRLPGDQGIIFSRGCYLQTGELRLFDTHAADLQFERCIAAPNREDHLFVFNHRARGEFILLPYNIITQKVETPIHCHGFCPFPNGEVALIRAESAPQKHHAIQIWQTPFTAPGFQADAVRSDSYLFKIGNPELVRCMAECHELLALLHKEDTYAGLYTDLQKLAATILDAYFWLDRAEAFQLREPLAAIREAAAKALAEFDRVLEMRRHAASEAARLDARAHELLSTLSSKAPGTLEAYVQGLSGLRALRGELQTLRDLRYADAAAADRIEKAVSERTDSLSAQCVEFLLGEQALQPYHQRVAAMDQATAALTKAAEGKALSAQADAASQELEMLIEVVGGLRIEDATQTTRIVDAISGIYAALNQSRARLRQRLRTLQSGEGAAQFAAQLKLLGQAVVNYLDLADSPAKCDEFLSALMVQIEELEGRFAGIDECIVQLGDKRSEVHGAFEAKKIALNEARGKRASALLAVAERMLRGIQHRAEALPGVNEINAFFASDLMVAKLRDTVTQLLELGDAVKADDLQSRLKTLREDTVRRLQDRQELYQEGGRIIAFGKHRFNISALAPELTILPHQDGLAVHLTGTGFFDPIEDPVLRECRPVWDLDSPSESPAVARAEFLAWRFLGHLESSRALDEASAWPPNELAARVLEFMGPRYAEGYTKGVHDHDAALILRPLIAMRRSAGLLRHHPEARALAIAAWSAQPQDPGTAALQEHARSFGHARTLAPGLAAPQLLLDRLHARISAFLTAHPLFAPSRSAEAALYLLEELTLGAEFSFTQDAFRLFQSFESALRAQRLLEKLHHSLSALGESYPARFELTRQWMDAHLAAQGAEDAGIFRDEAVHLFLRGQHHKHRVIEMPLHLPVTGLLSQHPRIQDGTLQLGFLDFTERLQQHDSHVLPLLQRFQETKQRLLQEARDRLRIHEFQPRVLASFVRNRLLDSVLLPLIGANLAKQIGTAGESKRTDLMGLLLLISPPGYGKTTVMEYVASRLGVVFVKINGPALGHRTTSLDPADAPNAAAREELHKLNLAFEMGDNVMIYVDDIQHCHPEFLQKFISLCDGQRRIEGVYRGRPKTYDFRGRKVAVVMAGNPYTESGEKFRIPDMLANRADTFNLGDLAGLHAEAFHLSYIENALTSNPALNALASRSRADIHGIIRIASTGSTEGITLEGGYPAAQLQEMTAVMRKLLRVRDVMLRVNAEYIRSAGQNEAFRTEPPFLLQGSYRNMNRIAEKVAAVMDDGELEALIFEHYKNEAQTLATGAEANLLRFHELMGTLSPEQQSRWDHIKKTFQRNLLVRGAEGEDPVSQVVRQLSAFHSGLESIRDALLQAPRPAASPSSPSAPPPPSPPSGLQEVAISPETLAKIWELIDAQQDSTASPKPRKKAKEPPPETMVIRMPNPGSPPTP